MRSFRWPAPHSKLKKEGSWAKPIRTPSAASTRIIASSATRCIKTMGSTARLMADSRPVRSTIEDHPWHLRKVLATARFSVDGITRSSILSLIDRHSERNEPHHLGNHPAVTPAGSTRPRASPGPRGSFTVTPEGHALRFSVNNPAAFLSTPRRPEPVPGSFKAVMTRSPQNKRETLR